MSSSVFSMHHDLLAELYTADQVRELDRIAIKELNTPGFTLMGRAASFSYGVLTHHWPKAERVVVVCGGGNNAGDGYVLAGLAVRDEKDVTVMTVFDPDRLTGDAKTAYGNLIGMNVTPVPFSETELKEYDVIVDALFGTGLDRDIDGEVAGIVDAINAAPIPVLSLDIPSGLNADTGNVMGTAVKADISATFIGLKRGMFTADGPHHSGQIAFHHLDVPEETYQRLGTPAVRRLDYDTLSASLTPRAKNAHKGHFGHVLIIGGDHGYLGAARMAAEAAARVGAGLVSVATRAEHAGLVSAVRPEIMSHGVETLDQLMPLVQRATVIAIGPGLGQSEWAKVLLARVLEAGSRLVIDADALNLLTEDQPASKDWVITPHPGEAARLLGTDTETVQADRFVALRKLQETYPGPVVLKGSGTLVADSAGHCFLCDAGNPGMSSGGMGDVLTGVIAGLIAQGTAPDQAAKLGVCLHALAADEAAGLDGERGLIATDLMPHLRSLVNP